jgi:hypothetical protein
VESTVRAEVIAEMATQIREMEQVQLYCMLF